MKKSLRILVALSIAASSILFVPAASARAPYDGTNGDVFCTTAGSNTGFFTIEDNVVISNSSCAGTVDIPTGVTSIGANAFNSASALTSLTIPNSVTSIGIQAFVYASSLTSLTIPNSVTSIGISAFYGATSLASLTIGNGVTSIGAYAFFHASTLTTVVIPNSVTSIGANAFNGASAMTSLTLGSSVTSIGNTAFYGPSSLISLTIPNSVTSIGGSAFSGATSLTSLTIGNSVTSIGAYAFYDASRLTTVVIPNSVISIDNGAFNSASALTSLIIGNSVTSIGEYTFYGTNLLLSYSYCDNLLSNLALILAGLDGKTKICTPSVPNAPTSVTAILTSATTANVSFTAPTSNGGAAITSYTATSSPGGITGNISQAGSGTIAVAGLTAGTRYTFTITATNLVGTSSASSASSVVVTSFAGTSGDVACGTSGYFTVVNNGVTLSTGCTGSVIIPQGVTSVGRFAFYSDGNFSSGNTLEDFIIALVAQSDLAVSELTIDGASAISSVSIPNSVTSIGQYAFYGINSPTTLIIPNSVTSIGLLAFAYASSLTSLTISDNVTLISQYAFFGTNSSLSTYEYCGTALVSADFSAAGLSGKTNSCITAPTAPTSVVATATGKRSATVSFGVPTSNGRSVITSYIATSSVGGFTQTLTQATGGTFTFDGLEPATSYTFTVTATNAIGTSSATTSNAITTVALDVASISSLTYLDDGDGTGGKLTWAGVNIASVLYTGPTNSYPLPYKYGNSISGWNGRLMNLRPDTAYAISITANSVDGLGITRSLIFKTISAPSTIVGVINPTIDRSAELAAQLPRLRAWIDLNVVSKSEANRMKRQLNNFLSAKVLKNAIYLKLPYTRVSKVSATSLTTSVCTVENGLVVKSISAGICTISYTVSDRSEAPATMVRDFIFRKFAK